MSFSHRGGLHANGPAGRKSPTSAPFQFEEARRDEARKARVCLVVETAEAADERRNHHLRRAPCPIVRLDRKAEPGFGQRGAEYALGARLGEDARPKQAHHFRVEAASSGDGQGMRGDGGANARRGVAAFLR